ncbi:MAG TPA: hypothetical protein VHJ34_15545 [Actinomycetota bacterium]|nr:hypothetical protein [Actinomycetota bacterium]
MGRRGVAVAIAVLLVGAAAPVASAQEVVVDLADEAALVGAGEAVTIDVTVSCPKKHDVLEALVYVVQDDHTSQFAGIPIRKCKGRPRTHTVTVRAFEDHPFHAGEAYSSAYVLVTTPSGGTLSDGDSHAITIH